MTTWRVLHYVALIAWLGGGMAVMVAGIVIMLVIYTGWGLWEIMTMPKATLP